MERTRARVTKPEYNRNGGVKGNHANGVAVARLPSENRSVTRFRAIESASHLMGALCMRLLFGALLSH